MIISKKIWNKGLIQIETVWLFLNHKMFLNNRNIQLEDHLPVSHF